MWKYKSEDFDTISLHDNFISSIENKSSIIVKFLDGFDVRANNMQNITGRHKHTANGIIELVDGKLLEAFYSDRPECNRREHELTINELTHIEILESGFDEKTGEFTVYGIIGRGFCRVRFFCSKVLICWNEYTSDAWFQDWELKNGLKN